MNRVSLLFPVCVLLLAACDQTAVKKEAYDQGFAAGKAEAAKELAARSTSRRMGTALDRPGTPIRSQSHGTGPASHLQGTALDQKPQKR